MSSYDDIASCAEAYGRARDQLAHDQDAITGFVAVLRARVALAECLIRAGWTPSMEVQHLLMLDRQLLAEPTGQVEARFARD